MKDTEGLEVLEKIRQKFSNIPVILITAYRKEMSEALEKALALNAYAYYINRWISPNYSKFWRYLKARLKGVLG